MNKKGKKRSLLLGFFIFFIMACFTGYNYVYADFWSDAKTWFEQGQLNNTAGNAVTSLVSEIGGYINITGTAVIVMATIVLGLRYIMGNSSDKARVKESLITLLVACVFFFGWTNISSILISGKDLIIYQGTGDYNSAVLKIYYLFKFVAQIIAAIAIVYVGIKYIFAGATGKAELKDKSWMFIIGIILVFASIEVLTFVSNVIINSTQI